MKDPCVNPVVPTWAHSEPEPESACSAVGGPAEVEIIHSPQKPRHGSPDLESEKLSQVLLKLADRFCDQPPTIGAVLEAAGSRGYNLLLIVLVLPFLTPVSIPFLSTPFGLAVAFIGLRIALGKKPALSEKLRTKELPRRVFQKLLRAGSRMLRWLEYFLKPRFTFVQEHVLFQRATGVLIGISGLLLLLPLPIPFTNLFPAVTILLLAAAALERDGFGYFVGWLMFVVSVAYFVLLALGGREVADQLRQMITGG